jgi:hypothetical protein
MIYLSSEFLAFILNSNYTQVHLLLVSFFLLWSRRYVPFVLSRSNYLILLFFIFHLVYSIICGIFDRSQSLVEAIVYGVFPVFMLIMLSNLRKEHLDHVVFILVIGDIVNGYLVPVGQRSSAGFSLGLLLLDMRYILPLFIVGLYPIFVNNMRSTFVFYFGQLFALILIFSHYARIIAISLILIVTFWMSSFIVNNPAVVRLSTTLFSEEFKVDNNEEGGRIGEVHQAWQAFMTSQNYLRFVLGAGSGFQYFDLKTQSQRSHLHVTPAAVFFRFGLLGTVIFFMFWFRLFSSASISYYHKFTLFLILISSFFSGSLMIIQNLIYVKYIISQKDTTHS